MRPVKRVRARLNCSAQRECRQLLGSTVRRFGASSHVAKEMHLRPNIVFIMADDLGYADLSCCGRRDFTTPNIDRIAERGVRFTQAYANSAVCSATRLALITGRYQYRLPLGLEEPLAGKTDVGLPPEHPTLPSLLRDAGYATSLIGKWHLGVLPAFGPLQSGYEHFWGFRTGALDYYSHRNARDEADLWDGDVAVQQTGYMTDLLGDRAVDTIERHAESKQPVPAQPALQCAALAVGGAWRSAGVRAAAQHAAAPLRRRHAAHLCPHGTGDGPPDRPRAAGTRCQRTDRATPSSSSPATTAASASPTPGRSPASRPNCWRAACAFPP